MKIRKMTCQFLAVLFLIIASTISWADIIEDDFNDNNLNTGLWTSFGEFPSRYAIETKKRFKIVADGTQDDCAGVTFNTFLSIDQDFRVQVDFNSLECSGNSVIGLMVGNAFTDIEHFDEYIAIVNGYDDGGYMTSRSWLAGKAFDDDFVETEIQQTTSTSGTLYIEYSGSTFYVSFTGYGAENAIASFTIDDWTSCSEVIIRLFVWSGYQALSGKGSYFDNFKLKVGDLDCYAQLDANGLPELVWPLEGEQSNYEWYEWDYEWTWSSCGGSYLKHIGLDITSKLDPTVGKTVYAAYNGTVVARYSTGQGWGRGVTIEHIDNNGNKFTTNYTHIDPGKKIKKNVKVFGGQPIGTIANITRSSPHLHFSIRRARYSNVANAGALPVVDQENCTCTYKTSYGRKYTRRIFPEYFIDPATAY